MNFKVRKRVFFEVSLYQLLAKFQTVPTLRCEVLDELPKQFNAQSDVVYTRSHSWLNKPHDVVNTATFLQACVCGQCEQVNRPLAEQIIINCHFYHSWYVVATLTCEFCVEKIPKPFTHLLYPNLVQLIHNKQSGNGSGSNTQP